MKVNKNLSRYVLDANGEVYDQESGVRMEYFKDQLKLTTDEKFVSSITGKASNIVRRFSREQIVKIWNDKESVLLSKLEKQSKTDPEAVTEVKKEIEKPEPTEKKPVNESKDQFQYLIQGTKYLNAGEAGKALGVSGNTIKNRVKKGLEGYEALC